RQICGGHLLEDDYGYSFTQSPLTDRTRRKPTVETSGLISKTLGLTPSTPILDIEQVEEDLRKKDNKVRDHSHFTGEYRGAAHSKCNINYRDVRFVPVIFHNLSGYDSHLFIREVATGFPGRVWVLPQTKERYISFVKFMEDQRLSFRFIDSFKFMASSLDNLAKNLKQQPTLRKVFGQDYDSAQIDLLTKKGVFPYEYISSLEKLQETALPPPEQF
ncbi:unnamed protein product, partial [Trichogramma brassicae]